jgi:hypothetical protein
MYPIESLEIRPRLAAEQAVEKVRSIAGVCSDHLSIEGRVMIGDVGVEKHAWLTTITKTDLPGRLVDAMWRTAVHIAGGAEVGP